jgi:type II secretory ATPase GspE/PulE/Tfp pilus assembly ATPase PilB-like protein
LAEVSARLAVKIDALNLYPPSAPVVARLKALGVLQADWAGELFRGKDCAGFPPGGESGRVGAYETLFVTDRLRDAVDRAAPLSELENSP